MPDHIISSTNPRFIAACRHDPAAVAWVSDHLSSGARETLNLWTPGQDEPEVLVSKAHGLGAPKWATFSERSLLVCPVSRDGESYRLEVFCLDSAKPTTSFTIEGSESPAPGEVAICRTDSGFFLCWERWIAGSVELYMSEISLDLEPVAPRPLHEKGVLSRSPRLAFDGAHHWLAWMSAPRRGARWTICVKELKGNGARLILGEGRFGVGGLDLAAARTGRLWVAWHTNQRPLKAPDLTRWVEVRAIIGDRIKVLSGAPLERRWGVLGEDQGLEFPVLVPQSDGRLSLFCRSSHRHWRFDTTKRGWSPPEPVDSEGWECRSRRMAAVLDEDKILIARRQRHNVVIDRIPASPQGVGLPNLLPERLARRSVVLRKSRPQSQLGEYQIYFGDIHQHTACSDGTGTVRETYERARDEYGDGFASVTDHESFLGKRIGAGDWRRMMAECDLHNEPGRFVTLPGFEWTGSRHPGPGHRCVYWPTADCPLLGREHPDARTSVDLIRSVRRLGGLVFPHHVGWTGADPSVHDPLVQTCWEIVSSHGTYEALDSGPIGQRDVPLEGHFLRDQLDSGLRFGFVGGSDGHGLLWHHGIAHRRDSHRTGLTAILVEELTREHLFDALRARRCYATSGVKMILDLRVNGLPMGSELKATTLRVEAMAKGTAELAKAELIMSSGAPIQLATDGMNLRVSLSLEPSQESPLSYLYLRVEQEDGEIAWSSPCWLLP